MKHEWDVARLMVARDYLLEHWELVQEPYGGYASPTAEPPKNAGKNEPSHYPGDEQLAAYLPHYRRDGLGYPLFTERQRQLLLEIGVDVGVYGGTRAWTVKDCNLRNFGG